MIGLIKLYFAFLMPKAWDGSGSFTRTNGTHTGATTWANSRDAGNNITASLHDTHDQDLADGINACLAKNGENGATGDIKPATDNATDLGSSPKRWRRLYVAGYIGDANGNELLKFAGGSASAVNELQVGNAETTGSPTLSASGGDTNISLALKGKGTGEVIQFDASNNNIGWVPRGYMSGFTYANNGSDATNDIDIAAGLCRDSTDARNIRLSASITKRLDAAWAVGTNQGGLDTGAIGNSDYYIWAIMRSDTGVVDVLFSLSPTAPTMPTNYDYKRLIGWFKRVGATIVAFHTYETVGGGLEMNWDVPTLDVNLSNTLTTSRRTDAVKVPLNFSTVAHLNVIINDATTANLAWICCPDQTDAAPSGSVAPLSNIAQPATATVGNAQMFIRTSATGTIAARSTLATVDSYQVSTMGFTWSRR